MSKNTQRKSLLTGASVLAAVAAGLSATPAVAQDDAIVVTGTRVTNPNLVASSPVTSVDSQDFSLSGTTRVEDLVNQLPQLAPSFDSFTVNPTTGFATADLRGLGTARTLVLVNGHRLQPGGIRSEARDLNQIPAALVQRVEVLTGGASAVYGSDAVAGVVNFILDNNFEGVSINAGWSAYQHNNSNEYIQGLMDARGFSYPTGDTGFDGVAYNFDATVGSSFDGGRGHAVAYVTYRQNEELRQGARDYSTCALSAAGTSCGGSPTAPNPYFFQDFFLVDGANNPIINHIEDPENPGTWIPEPGSPSSTPGQVFVGVDSHLNPDSTWALGPPALYNYAPINHYQRPDERWTFGATASYEINRHFRPYIETMFTNTNTAVQIAESGTFFVNTFELDCANPLLGTFCAQFGAFSADVDGEDYTYTDATGTEQTVTAFIDPNEPVFVAVGKRNNEGGPRIAGLESNSFRAVVGVGGDLSDSWTYDVSFLYGRNASSESNINDFIPSLIEQNVLNCLTLAATDPNCYNVFQYGGVTPESAALLAGAGIRTGATSLQVISGYISGDIGISLPAASDPISLVVGLENRREAFDVTSDANMATGNFAGLGGPRPSISGRIAVTEVFGELGIPVIQDAGLLNSLALDFGYRMSNYTTSGVTHSYKAGASAQIADVLRIRGGYNRAIRAANTNELFADQQISLWGGNDPCAGETPTLTLAQCQNTGMSASQYGNVTANAASQNNQFSGGNPSLDPEIADTFTIGFVATPLPGLNFSVDYYDVSIEDRIGSIGASTILTFCATTGDPFLCDKVNRGVQGDLWRGSDPATAGYVENLNANFGNLRYRGVDISAGYRLDLGPGSLSTQFSGSYYLEQEIEPLPGVNPAATFDCAGVINTVCQQPSWRHMLRATYAWDRFTASVRWRHVGAMDYENQNGTPGTADLLVVSYGREVPAWDFFDVSGSIDITSNATVTFGVNNIMDEEPPMVGNGLVLNANSIGGYDQLGRYFFGSVGLRF